jgi:hypothetical protein
LTDKVIARLGSRAEQTAKRVASGWKLIAIAFGIVAAIASGGWAFMDRYAEERVAEAEAKAKAAAVVELVQDHDARLDTITDEVKELRTEVGALGRLQVEQIAWLVQVDRGRGTAGANAGGASDVEAG